ncbi:DUF4158 domain-containing protein [Peterkaempfera bronchialis]|uniref:DUF4158 domain-containing protein n=1 Tax=Peterkaempfera bronchialis TaxID=2126346 RepID=UPI002696844B
MPAVSYVAQQVKVPAEEWAAYDWSGRAIKRHRIEIQGAFGFRECSEGDQAQLAEWLAVELCGVELNRDRLAEAVVARCRKDRLEPPAPGQITRLVGGAVSTFEERFCAATVGRLSAATRSRLDDLIAEDAGADEESAGGGGTFFTELKADPGALGLDSLLAEVNKLQRVRGLKLPPELFGDRRARLTSAFPASGTSTTSGTASTPAPPTPATCPSCRATRKRPPPTLRKAARGSPPSATPPRDPDGAHGHRHRQPRSPARHLMPCRASSSPPPLSSPPVHHDPDGTVIPKTTTRSRTSSLRVLVILWSRDKRRKRRIASRLGKIPDGKPFPRPLAGNSPASRARPQGGRT